MEAQPRIDWQGATEQFALPIIDRYLGGESQIVPMGSFTDVQGSTDAISGNYQIAIRVRDYRKYKAAFHNDFTIRNRVASGRPTEWDKLNDPNSKVTHGLYALWNPDHAADGFPCFALYRIAPIRALRRQIEAGGYTRGNSDGTGFYAIPWGLFKGKGFVVALRCEDDFPLLANEKEAWPTNF